jgi:hypothetical protein
VDPSAVRADARSLSCTPAGLRAVRSSVRAHRRRAGSARSDAVALRLEVLLEERAPTATRFDRDEAVTELVRRYFAGHGPATERDLSYWASMTLTDIRAGLAAAGDQLDHVEHNGRTFWFAGPPPTTDPTLEPRGHLLQILDEYHNGYQDSRGVLDIAGIVPSGRAANVGMALVDGQMVGGMRRTLRTSDVTFHINLFRDLDPDELAALEAAAARYGDFLGRDATLAAVAP